MYLGKSSFVIGLLTTKESTRLASCGNRIRHRSSHERAFPVLRVPRKLHSRDQSGIDREWIQVK